MELYRLEENRWGIVTRLELTGPMLRRALDLGLTEGCRVQCVLAGRRGGPGAYLIRGAVIALRAYDADRIRVREVTADG